MSLRAKVITVVSAVSLLYAAMIYLVGIYIVFPGFIELEKREAIESADRVIRAINSEADHLSTFTHDWSAWDDTYEFADDRNEEFIEDNLLDETFIDSKLDLIYITDAEGRIIYGRVFSNDNLNPLDLKKNNPDRLPRDHPLFLTDNPSFSLYGILAAKPYPLIVASEPIITSENQGPVRGYLIMGRFLDEEYIDVLRQQTRIDFDVLNLKGQERPQRNGNATLIQMAGNEYDVKLLSKNRLSVGFIYLDIKRSPALYITAYIERDVTRNGATVLRFTQASVIAAGLIVLLVITLHIGGVIIDPLTQFTSKIVELRKSGDLTKTTNLVRDDEIGTLSKEFDNLLSELREARKELSEHSYRAGLADISSGLIHNLRNSVTPILTNIHSIELDLDSMHFPMILKAMDEYIDTDTSSERRDDLKKYLMLSIEKTNKKTAELKSSAKTITAQTVEIEKLLAQHESLTFVDFVKESINVEEVVFDAFKLVPEQVRPNVKVEYIADETVPETVQTDRLVLLHVLLNLLHNACESIESSGKDTGLILVRTFVKRSDGCNLLEIHVADDGAGISEDAVGMVFNRGYTTKSTGKGGFGLHWCSNAIASRGGSIAVESKGKGMGATFRVKLPIDK